MSSGPAANLATLTLSIPTAAPADTAVPVRTQVVVRHGGPRIVAHPSSSSIEVLRNGIVVARESSPAGPAVPMPLTAGTTLPAQTVPSHVRLIGCDGAKLAPGAYAVRAVIGYGADPLNAAADASPGRFALVSDPVPLTVV